MYFFEFFIARRYLKGSRRTLGGGLTSVIAVAGVAVGVAALVATLAVMTGFREDIRAKILGAQPHLLIQPPGSQGLPERDYTDRFEGISEVVAWSPYVLGQALFRGAQGTQGVVVKGVDPAREPGVTGLDRHVVVGSWADLASSTSSVSPVFLGKALASGLGIGVGDMAVLAVSSPEESPWGALPSFFQCTVAGVLETGLYDYDSSLVVLPLSSAQRLFNMKNRVTGLGVRLQNADEFAGPAIQLQARFSSEAYVRSWLGLNRPLFAALRLEKNRHVPHSHLDHAGGRVYDSFQFIAGDRPTGAGNRNFARHGGHPGRHSTDFPFQRSLDGFLGDGDRRDVGSLDCVGPQTV
jgi:lipoprotein-releasing system permease protein